MIALRVALEQYLSIRQGLGYKYQHQTRRLADFVAFMEQQGAVTITTKLALAWATLPANRHASWALRLSDVRGFARHVANIDPNTEVPPTGLLPPLKRATMSCRNGGPVRKGMAPASPAVSSAAPPITRVSTARARQSKTPAECLIPSSPTCAMFVQELPGR